MFPSTANAGGYGCRLMPWHGTLLFGRESLALARHIPGGSPEKIPKKRVPQLARAWEYLPLPGASIPRAPPEFVRWQPKRKGGNQHVY